MIGNEDISKALKVMHSAAKYEFESGNELKAIDILNNARNIELKTGFKNQAAETMLEIAEKYHQLHNYELSLWFAKEALQILQKTKKTSILKKANILIENVLQESSLRLLAT